MLQRNGPLPPKIQELLKKKGWTWPPNEEMRAERAAAWRRLDQTNDRWTPEEMLAVLEGEPGFERLCEEIRRHLVAA
jgi:hypothetical protein